MANSDSAQNGTAKASQKRPRADAAEPGQRSMFAGLEDFLERSIRQALAEHIGTSSAFTCMPKDGNDICATTASLQQRVSILERELKELKENLQSTSSSKPNTPNTDHPGRASVADTSPASGELTGSLTLKVGSRKFQTTAETLKSVPDSFFSSLASGRIPQKRERDGSIFIDRNPKHFQYVLDYLRCNGEGFTPPMSKTAQDELRTEADYYGLVSLALSLRRLCVASNHLLTIGKKGALLSGNRFGAAMLDVRDPDNFAITLSVDMPDDGGAHASESPLFFGIAPAGTDVSQEWMNGQLPVVPIPPLPCQDGDAFWTHYNKESASVAQEPSKGSYPPAITNGVFFAHTNCKLNVTHRDNVRFDPGVGWTRNSSTAATCYQFVQKDLKLCTCSVWTFRSQPRMIRMHFHRDSEGASLEFRFSKASDARVWRIDLNAEGIDSNCDYRPAIFFTRHGMSATVEELLS